MKSLAVLSLKKTLDGLFDLVSKEDVLSVIEESLKERDLWTRVFRKTFEEYESFCQLMEDRLSLEWSIINKHWKTADFFLTSIEYNIIINVLVEGIQVYFEDELILIDIPWKELTNFIDIIMSPLPTVEEYIDSLLEIANKATAEEYNENTDSSLVYDVL